ncbi:MAG: hypothetical protein LKF52_02180 [Butyrivibrio sp.]|jgi:hypothetical protein|nr:hypothetical protein [Butyrivibrio sp.]
MNAIKIKDIITRRKCDKSVFYDVCYEWEDILAEKLNVPLYDMSNVDFLYKKIKGKILPNSYSISQNVNVPISIYILISYTDLKLYSNINGIPIFIDIWNDIAIDFIMRKMQKFYFFVTSKDVYNRFKEKYPKCNVLYCQLSVSDKYFSQNFKDYSKVYDVIQVGRRNELLHGWMLEYVKKNPDIEYIYSQKGSTVGSLEYISTKRGSIGEIKSREEYIKILSENKVSLVSSPGIDSSRKQNLLRADYLTPRFYESAVLGCALIGRYTLNEENFSTGISNVCPMVNDYLQFEKALNEALAISMEGLYRNNETFIRNSLTSSRIEQITKGLREINES